MSADYPYYPDDTPIALCNCARCGCELRSRSSVVCPGIAVVAARLENGERVADPYRGRPYCARCLDAEIRAAKVRARQEAGL